MYNLLKTCPGEKVTRMFYIAGVINFGDFLELLWNPNLNLHVTSCIGSGLHRPKEFDIKSLLVWKAS